jgi:hypothetical protein
LSRRKQPTGIAAHFSFFDIVFLGFVNAERACVPEAPLANFLDSIAKLKV